METYQLKSFWSLNKAVVPFLLKRASLIFSASTLIGYLIISYDIGEWSFNIETAFFTVLVSGVALPLLVLAAGYAEWLKNRRNRKRVYNRHPFTELFKIGFSSCIIGHHWTLFEEVQMAKIAGFKIYADANDDKPKYLQFHFAVEYPTMTSKQRRQFKKELKSIDIDIASNTAYIQYNTKKPSIESIAHLEKELHKVVNILIAKGLSTSLKPQRAELPNEK